jgi:hypothetical protein
MKKQLKYKHYLPKYNKNTKKQNRTRYQRIKSIRKKTK